MSKINDWSDWRAKTEHIGIQLLDRCRCFDFFFFFTCSSSSFFRRWCFFLCWLFFSSSWSSSLLDIDMCRLGCRTCRSCSWGYRCRKWAWSHRSALIPRFDGRGGPNSLATGCWLVTIFDELDGLFSSSADDDDERRWRFDRDRCRCARGGGCFSCSRRRHIASSSVRRLWNETWLIDFSKKRWREDIQLNADVNYYCLPSCHLIVPVRRRTVVEEEWSRINQWKYRKQWSSYRDRSASDSVSFASSLWTESRWDCKVLLCSLSRTSESNWPRTPPDSRPLSSYGATRWWQLADSARICDRINREGCWKRKDHCLCQPEIVGL